jgi:PAS domain S-box-containing protein
MENRKRLQQRGVLLSFAGISIGFLIAASFRLAGFWDFELTSVWSWVLITAAVHAGLLVVLHLEWPRYQALDPHFLYLPWASAVALFSCFVYAFPEARALVPFGYLLNLLFVVGLAGFWEVVAFSLLMAAGYFSAVLLLVQRGEPVSVGFEALMAGLVLALGTFAGTVLERARRHGQNLRRTADQLRKFSLAVEQGPSLLIITDTAGHIEYVNPKFTRTTGYTLDEVRGLTPRVLKSEETPPDVYDDLWQTIQTGNVWQKELKNVKKNGEPYWVIASISPLRNASGRTTHYLGVQEDITERKEIEAQLVQAQKMESVGQLVSGVAHDFNNLLTGVLGFSELALAKVQNGDPLRQDLMEIRKAGESASALTQQLLAFSRQQMLRPEVIDLNEVLESIENLLRRTMTENVELAKDLAPDLGLVRADPAQIQQILVNLAVNARDAMPDGGRLIIATSNAELGRRFANEHVLVRQGRYVMLAVSDTGRGMDEETRKRVFEPFFTTKERGRGTGLGLATVYGIVKQSRGYIWVYSEPGRGATFKIFLPRVVEPPDKPVIPEAVPAQIVGAETILLVEDDKVVRTLAESILKARGYRVLAAENGEDAIGLWKTGGIDLLITDIVMPAMNGVELARHLTALRSDLKVLLLSGYAEQAIVEDTLADQGTPFMGKPFKVTEFLDKVRTVLDST